MKLLPQQRQRLASSLKKMAMVLLAGLAYYLFVRITGWGIPCVFYLLSGRYCPGCGVSRMCMALLRLNIPGALRANPLLMCLLPVGAAFGLRRWLIYVKTGEMDMDLPEKIAVVVAFVITMAFWVLRNLPQFAYLTPNFN